ncbi:MAG: cadmium-translocating P-type ATPase [Lachnospiraceae bacterium]|nr:cadmium-translocating P-type ATPase [Lachnospiraceae bacterium]
MITKIYTIENLDCANCAAKIERKALSVEGVIDLSVTFSTMQLRITAEDPDSLLPAVSELAKSVEPDINFLPYKRASRKSSSASHNEPDEHEQNGHTHHHHDDECCCGEHDEHGEHTHEHSGHTHHHHDGDCCCGEHDEHDEHKHSAHSHHHDDDCCCGEHDEHKHSAHSHHHHDDCGCGHEHDKNEAHDHRHERHETHEHSSVKSEAHEHEDSSHVHEHSHEHDGDIKRDFIEIAAGVVLFIIALILKNKLYIPSIILFALSYIVLGYKVLIKAAKNIRNGHVFDENFLMSIATLGAFAIKNFAEGVGVMLFYRIGALFEDIAVNRSRSQIIDAIDMRPETVSLVSYDSDEVKTIPAEDALEGDILLVRPGDRIPLDGIITEGETRIDTSPVTGEPVPVKAVKGDYVTSGCINNSGVIKIKVVHVLEESMVTKILNSVENAAAGKPKIDRFITKFARIYTPVVVAIAILTAIIPSIITGDWHKWIYTALSFLVISCPCALVLSVPLAFFSGIGAGSKRGILFKSGLSLEALANVKSVVMDKTGTITKGDFSVQSIVSALEYTPDELLAITAACESNSTHPIACSIVEAAKKRELTVPKADSIEEISGHGIKAMVNGHTVLCGNKKLLDMFNVSYDNYKNNNYGSEVITAIDGKYAGYIVISDTIKQEAVYAINNIKKQGITTAMLTGDSNESAANIAKLTGIDEYYAKLLPEDKVSRLSEIREKSGSVMFVGDGINDAPVLAGADVGAAMGSGADAAIEAADVVIMKSDMTAIPTSIKIAKSSAAISRQNVIFALAIKAAFMILGLLGFASMWMAVFADTGVAVLCILNSIRALYKRY